MEFLDNAATCDTSLVTKMTFPIIKNTYTTILYTYTTFRELPLASSGETSETPCVDSVVYVFLVLHDDSLSAIQTKESDEKVHD
jgi:hypothetical protein